MGNKLIGNKGYFYEITIKRTEYFGNYNPLLDIEYSFYVNIIKLDYETTIH